MNARLRHFNWRLALIALLPLAVLLPYMGGFIYTRGAQFNDLVISHYPNALFLRDSVLAGHGIPLWSNTILSGYPFAADPLSGLWYPPGWLALLLPLPLGFNVLMALHFIFGGLGMYGWLRLKGLSPNFALLGGLSFLLLPKLYAHLGAGHLSLAYAVPWTPWLLWAGDARPLRKSGWVLPGLALGMIALADVRWAAFAGGLWLAYVLMQGDTPWSRRVVGMIASIALALLVAAPLLVPLVEYARHATRAVMTSDEALLSALEPASLLGLLFPTPGGNHEASLYAGGVSLALLVLTLTWRELRQRVIFWLWTALGALLLSLGGSIPGVALLWRLPGLSWVRVPSRALFILGLSLSVISAYAGDSLYRQLQNRGSQKLRWTGPVLFALSAFAVLMAAGGILMVGRQARYMAWGAVCLALATFIIMLALGGKLRGKGWLPLVIALMLLDLGAIDQLGLEGRAVNWVNNEGHTAAALIAGKSGQFRVYSPSYSIPQQTALRYGLELADGVDPLQLQAYVKYMDTATNVPRAGYSVTMPPLATGSPARDNAGYTPDARKLGWLSVGYVAAEYDLDADGLVKIAQFEQTRVYRNEYLLPWARVIKPDGSLVEAQVLIDQPNRLEIRAEGPGRLVLAEIAYPGWMASLDGKTVPMLVEGGLLRAVELPEGQHIIELRFRPVSVWAGLTLGVLAWIAGLSLLRIGKKKGEPENAGYSEATGG